jgi:hypothetical protein
LWLSTNGGTSEERGEDKRSVKSFGHWFRAGRPAAANDLSLLGYGVTIYEALPVLGGMLSVRIPPIDYPEIFSTWRSKESDIWALT